MRSKTCWLVLFRNTYFVANDVKSAHKYVCDEFGYLLYIKSVSPGHYEFVEFDQVIATATQVLRIPNA